MKSFIEFISESDNPMPGVHKDIWKAHVKHYEASKRHYEVGGAQNKRAATRTFSTLQKKLNKHEPDKSKHLRIMSDMMGHSQKLEDEK